MRSNRPPWACGVPGWAAAEGEELAAGEPRALSSVPQTPQVRLVSRAAPSNPYRLVRLPYLRMRMAQQQQQLWVSDPAAVVAAVADPTLLKGSLYRPFRSLAPYHLIALEGAVHERLRGAVLPLVSGTALKSLLPLVKTHARELVDDLLHRGGADRLDGRVRQMTVDTISDALFGRGGFGTVRANQPAETGSPAAVTSPLTPAAALGVVMEAIHWRTVDLTDCRWSGLVDSLPPGNATPDAVSSFWADPRQGDAGPALALLDTHIRAEMADTGRPPALLDRIVQAGAKATPPLSSFEVRQMVMTLLTMGHENVSSGISWALLLLADDPDLQERARREVMAAVPSGDVRWEDLKKLPLLCRVFEEAVRLYPSVPGLTRCPRSEATCGAVSVPAGTEVVFNLYGAHRAVGPAAVDTSTDRRSLAFGGGARGCIGRQLAYLESLVVCVELLRRCRIRRVALGDGDPPKMHGAVFVSLRPGRTEAAVRVTALQAKL